MADMEMLNRIARRQRGLITAPQALACGLTAGQITSRLRNGTWVLIRPDVYAVAGAPQSWEQSLLAVTLSVPAFASHRTAGHLWPLRGYPQPEKLEVVTSYDQHVRLDEVHGHRSRALFDLDRTRRNAIPTVTAERALVDLSGSRRPGS